MTHQQIGSQQWRRLTQLNLRLASIYQRFAGQFRVAQWFHGCDAVNNPRCRRAPGDIIAPEESDESSDESSDDSSDYSSDDLSR